MKPNVNHILRESEEKGNLEARSLEEAIDKLSIQSTDAHPEKRMKVIIYFPHLFQFPLLFFVFTMISMSFLGCLSWI